jgi:early secretory antigenic target protein ESAT-6
VSEIVYDFARIQALASAIQGSVSTTQGLLDEGNTSLQNLAAAWGGSGSEAYQTVQRRWDATSAELNTSLRELSNRIDEAAAAMLATEKGVGNLFGG